MNFATRTFLPFLKLLICLFLAAQLSAQSSLIIIPEDDDQTTETHQLVWETKDGLKYELQATDDLTEDWSPVDGFPKEATSIVDSMPFGLDGSNQRFYRVVQIDEEAPEIQDRFPEESGFAIPRFSSVQIELQDVSQIDPGSIQIEVGTFGTLSIADSRVTFEDNILVFETGGDSPLGNYGETINVALTVADTLGNSANYAWSFQLESEAIVQGDILVLGSPEAQRAGQQLTASQRNVFRAVSPATGPIRMNAGASPWTLTDVGPNYLIFNYVGSPPTFNADQFLVNMAPGSDDEVFYRKVTSWTDGAPGANQITVFTQDISLLERIAQGSLILIPVVREAKFFEVLETGALVNIQESQTFGTAVELEIDFEDQPVNFNIGGHWYYTPEVDLAFNIKDSQIQDFYFAYSGTNSLRVESSVIVSGEVDYTATTKHPIYKSKHVVSLGFIGPVPIWLDVDFALDASATVGFGGAATMSAAMEKTDTISFDVTYDRDNPERNGWDNSPLITVLDTEGPDLLLEGEANASASLIPSIDAKLVSLFGVEADLSPTIGIDANGSILNGELESASVTAYGKIDFNAGLSLQFVDNNDLPSFDPVELAYYAWTWQYPEAQALAIIRQPNDVSAPLGDNISLQVAASASAPINYQWYKDGKILMGQKRPTLTLSNLTRGHAGDYRVLVDTASDEAIWSEVAAVSVASASGPGSAPEGMVLVEGGTLPAVSSLGALDVDTFYIGQTEVTWNEWQTVRTWAAANGYDIGSRGNGCADDHPVHTVAWYDVVKWSNAKSEMEDLAPVYTVSGSTYKSGEPDHTTIAQDLSASGYRLPTEAEWEFAARGGNQTNGYTYSGSNDLNEVGRYRDNSGGAACNLWSGRGTWPVGEKAANELGLNDMSGNVWEWCFDRDGSSNLFRGGGWNSIAYFCSVSSRSGSEPDYRGNQNGFRMARSSGNSSPAPDAGPTSNIRQFAPYAVDSDGNGTELISLDGSYSTEGDFPIISYNWKWFGGSATGETTSATFPVGTTFVTLTVRDSEGNSDADTMRVTVAEKPNASPTADTGEDQRTWTDYDGDGVETLPFDGRRSTDSDGTIVAYHWYWDGGTGTGATPELEFTVGSHLLTLQVTDDRGAIDHDRMTVTINPKPNEAPVAEAGSYSSLTDLDGNGSESVTLDGSASTDPDDNIVSYSWSFESDSTASKIGTWPRSGTNPTVTLGVGTTRIILTVTDAEGLQDTDPFAITVNPKPNEAPTADAGADQTLQDDDFDNLHAVRLDGSNSSDPDGSITSYQWTWAGGTASGASPLVSLPVGTTTVTLTVTDNRTGTDTDTVDITITASEISPVNPEMIPLGGGTLPDSSFFAGESVGNFQIGTYEVTWSQWTDVRNWAANNGYDLSDPFINSPHDSPANGMTWYDALKWCNALSEIEGKTPVYMLGNTVYKLGSNTPTANPQADGYRLPTEQEWEWAASDGLLHVGFDYSGSDTIEDVAVNGSPSSWPVGSKDPNLIGAYDMSGNVSEWTMGSLENHRSFKGGDFESAPEHCEVFWRRYGEPTFGSQNKGIRVARNWLGNAPTAQAGSDIEVTDNNNDGFEEITLSASASTDSDGTIVSYEWYKADLSSKAGVSVSYNLPVGVTTLYLIVEDNDGARDMDTITITVNEGTAVSDFAPDTLTYVDATISVTDATYSEDLGTRPFGLDPSLLGNSHHYTKVSANKGKIDYSGGGYTGTITLTFTSANAGTFYETYTGEYSGFLSGTFEINSLTP